MSEIYTPIQQPSQMEVVPANPMAIISAAIERGVSPENLEKLLTLQERWETNQSRKLFISAMALAKPKFGSVLKKADGYDKRYKYETLPDVIAAVDGPLGENGLTYDWITEDLEGGRIRVTCVLTHESGYSRSNSLSGHPDDTAAPKANMNAYQRLGGAVTYLQRYTLKAALGIAASEDTDGGEPLPDSPLIDAEQFRYLQDLIEKAGADEKKMLTFLKREELKDLNQKNYKWAEDMLRKLIAEKAAKAKVTPNAN